MVSSLETDTPANPDLIISIPVNPELIIVSSLDTDIPANPDLVMSIYLPPPSNNLDLIMASSL